MVDSVALTRNFFLHLDSNFINLAKKGAVSTNEPVLYKGHDILVQKVFEVPIPLMQGSEVKYSFRSTGGDLAFAVTFLAAEWPPENIFVNARVPSDVEPYTGTFKSTRDGTLLLSFDNTFSWFNTKHLTYNVELLQVFA